ncbi:MAG: GDSL-type esterase/lipase family protein [Cyanobacteria bacterium J06638_28]
MVAARPVMRSPAVLTPRHEKRIVAVGDSLVYGYGDPEGGGWVERLRRRWLQPESPGHAIYNLGVRGDGVQQVARRLEQEFLTRGEFRNRVPDLILLSVGMNDSARIGKPTGRPFTPLEVFEAEMAKLLDEASSLCPVLFVGMPPVWVEQMPFSEVLYYNHQDQFRYKEITAQACRQRQVPYLDIFTLWLERGEHWWRSRLASDGLHPNTAGYQALLKDITVWTPFQKLV